MTVTITDRAARQIGEILKSEPQGSMLRVSVEGLKPGMTVTRDLVSRHGVLIVAGGHKLDAQSIAALQRIADGSTEFLVYVQR